MTTAYYILTTQSVIILELVRIQLGFSSSDIINYLLLCCNTFLPVLGNVSVLSLSRIAPHNPVAIS